MDTTGTRSVGLREFSSPCELGGPFGISLQSLPGPKSSSGDEAGNSGFLSWADMDLGVPLEFPQRSQALSHVETCKSTLLSSCQSSVSLLSS